MANPCVGNDPLGDAKLSKPASMIVGVQRFAIGTVEEAGPTVTEMLPVVVDETLEKTVEIGMLLAIAELELTSGVDDCS